VVTGIPSAGQVRVDQRLRLAGSDDTVRVRRLEVYGAQADLGRAGECVAMNLADVEPERLGRGEVLTDAPRLRPVRYAEAELHILAHLQAPVADYLEVHVHVGTAEAMANLAILNDTHLPPGESRLVQLRFRQPLAVSPAERFVVRGSVAGLAGGRVTTLGGGTILDATDIRLRRNRPWTNDRLQRRAEALGDPIAWAGQVLGESAGPVQAGQLAEAAGMRPDIAAECLESLRLQGIALPTGDGRLAHRDRIIQLGRRATEHLRAFCQDHPLRLGLSADRLAERLESDPEMVRRALDKLAGESKLLCREGLYRPAEMPGGLDPEQLRHCNRIEQAFREAGLEPPSISQLAEKAGITVETAEPIVTLLIEQGRLVDLGKGIVMHNQAVGQGQQVAVDLLARAAGFTTMDFRDALGVSRKYAVPLLDHLDATRWTVRTGNRRRPGVLARRRLEA
jgi:selenocysteine-specific elongation factor